MTNTVCWITQCQDSQVFVSCVSSWDAMWCPEILSNLQEKKTLQMQFNFSTKPVKSLVLSEMTQIWLVLKDHQSSKSEIPVVRNHYHTFWLYMSKDSHGGFSGLQPTVQQNTTLLTHWWIITAQKAFIKVPCPQLSQHSASHYSSLLCADHQLDLHSRVLTCNMYMIT